MEGEIKLIKTDSEKKILENIWQLRSLESSMVNYQRKRQKNNEYGIICDGSKSKSWERFGKVM